MCLSCSKLPPPEVVTKAPPEPVKVKQQQEVRKPSRTSVAAPAAKETVSKPVTPPATQVLKPSRRSSRVVAPTTSRACKACGEQVEDNAIWDGPNLYHKRCFCCADCGKDLTGGNFYDKFLKLLCRDCYGINLYTCPICNDHLSRDGSELEQSDGRMAHVACVRPAKPLPKPVDSPASSPPPSPPVARPPRWSLEGPPEDDDDDDRPTGDDDDDILSLVLAESEQLSKLAPAQSPVQSRVRESANVEDDEIDALMGNLMGQPLKQQPPVPPPKPRRSEVGTEVCWNCNKLNPADVIECLACGETMMTMTAVPEEEHATSTVLDGWSLPEAGEFKLEEDDTNLMSPPVYRRSTQKNAPKPKAVRGSIADEDELSNLIAELADV